MSIEYTLDIQLTEMGFPEVVHPQVPSVADTPSNSDSTSHNSSLVNETEAGEPVSEEPSQPVVKKPAQVKKSLAKKAAAEEIEEHSSDSDVSYIEEDLEDEDDDDDEEEELEVVEAGNFQCNVCNLTFPSMFKLQDHMNLHSGERPYSCAECGKRFYQIRSYRDHLRAHARHRAKQHKCRICLKSYTAEADLKYHLTMNHFEEKFYECDRCKRVFTNLETCQHHIEFTCMRKVKCEKCNRYFPKEKLLRRHLESKRCYSNLKCADCPKVFTRKNALLKHSFSHLGLLPYTCIRCRCHFRLAKLYLRHQCTPQRIHCGACLREFLNDQDFQQHKKDTGCWGDRDKKGDEIRCLECGQRFETKEDLKKHAGAHQRVLKCAECGKGFRSALLLMSHMGGHAGQSPCLCQSCGLGFPHQQSYDSHLKMCGQEMQNTKPQKKNQSNKKKSRGSTSTTSSVETAMFPLLVPEAFVGSSIPLSYNTSSALPAPDNGPMQVVAEDSHDLPKVGQNQNNLLVPCAAPQVLSVPQIQVQASLVSNGIVGGTLASAVSGTLCKRDEESPLDLSQKTSPLKLVTENNPTVNIKSEAEEVEVSVSLKGGEEKAIIDLAKPLDKTHTSLHIKRPASPVAIDGLPEKKELKEETDYNTKT
ncbi:unnamed protein product [Knipowitschia caucasica]